MPKLQWFWGTYFQYADDRAWRLWGVWIAGQTFVGVSRSLDNTEHE